MRGLQPVRAHAQLDPAQCRVRLLRPHYVRHPGSHLVHSAIQRRQGMVNIKRALKLQFRTELTLLKYAFNGTFDVTIVFTLSALVSDLKFMYL